MNHNHTQNNSHLSCSHGCCMGDNHICNEKDITAESSVILYTCPMHPKVKKDKPGSCSECGMNLVPINKPD